MPVRAIAVAALLAVGAGWPTPLATPGPGLAQAQSLSVPSGVSAACASGTLSLAVTVSWQAVPHASAYTVLASTGGAYSPAATGVSATTWTSGALLAGTWTFEVVAVVGGAWSTPASAPTSPRTITVAVCS